MSLPRFFSFENYNVKDVKEFLSEGRIDIYLERNDSIQPRCHRCQSSMGSCRGDHFMKIETLPIMGHRTYLHFRRYKYHCYKCKKARSEAIPFLAEETPHLSSDYAFWIGRLCEIAPVSRVAEVVGMDGTTTWRVDYHRMIHMLSRYNLPTVKRISVDEVYVRRRSRYFGESKDQRYFTIITDLDTKKVIWVSDGRTKDSLDQFFKILGSERCTEIEVVATDQHEAYAASVAEYCPNAVVVWDRFHLVKNFVEVVNETRLWLHERTEKDSPIKKLTRSKNKFIFMKKASNRNKTEQKMIEEVMQENVEFFKLELIKERFISMFDEPDELRALFVWTEIGDWIKRCKFYQLRDWYENLNKKWNRLKTYFKYRVSTSLSEGINNVIKSIKRRGFGYRNMQYFKLKIMQVCGYLNSRHIPAEV